MRYKQKHPETCLAKCLLILLEKQKKIKTKNDKELEILNFSLKYDRESIARGHLEKVIKDFKVKINWYTGSKIFYDFIKKRKIHKGINLIFSKVDLKLINQFDKPIICYIDQFYLWRKERGLYYKYHYPHFIIIQKKIDKNYLIIDPNDGKEKKISQKLLYKSISSLKNKLWFSPQIIELI